MNRHTPGFTRILTNVNENQVEHLKSKLKECHQFLIDLAVMNESELIQDSQDWLIQLLEN